MIRPLLQKLLAREHLTQAEAAALLDALLGEEATDAQISAALVALAAKGETEEELAGFASVMRDRCARLTPRSSRLIDTCGTGGSAAKTFNVSTAAAFVVSGAGVPVAKHGNIGVTSRAGSADVLRALGVRIELAPEEVARCLDEIGICFMFAPLHHAATRRVAQVRRELGVRTIFNLLGPLTNPAGAPFQVIGVSELSAVARVAAALSHLGIERAWVVRGEDGLDEITLDGPTTVYEVTPGGVQRAEIAPAEFGFERERLDALRGGTATDNAALIEELLAGRRGERHDTARRLLIVNAAAALHVAGASPTLEAARELAEETIESGEARARLDALRAFTNDRGAR
jgi:anthranilate phosphoribosyltransferase